MVDNREKEQQGCKMFIGGLTSDTTKEMLEEYYGEWGEIIDAVVMVDSQTRKSRGFGFVTYTEKESVDECIKAAPHKIDNKTVETKRAVPRDACTPDVLAKTKKVFLGGLHLDTTEDEIRDIMQEFGAVEDAVIIREKGTKKPRGFGFVVFEDYDSADKLCSQRVIRIRERDVECKKAQSVDEMNRQRDYNNRYLDRRHDRRPGGGYMAPPPKDRYPQPPYPSYQHQQQPRYPVEYYQPAPSYGQEYPSYDTSYSHPPYRQTYESSTANAGYSTGMYGSYNPPLNPGYGGTSGGYQTYSGNGAAGYGGGMQPPPAATGGGYIPRSQGGGAARSYHPYRR